MSESLRSEVIGILSRYDVAWGENVVLGQEILFRMGDQPVVVPFDTAEDAAKMLVNKLQELGLNQKNEHPHGEAGRYTVFRSVNVIAVACEDGLTLPPGHILVIPLQHPNRFLTFSKEQFNDLFGEQPSELSEPTIQPPSQALRRDPEDMSRFTEPSGEGDVFRYLQRSEPMQAVTVASRMRISVTKATEYLRELRSRGVVVVEGGFWRPASRPAPPTPLIKPTAPPAPVIAAIQPPPYAARESRPVPPQLGRILLGMAYATKVTGKTELTTLEVNPYLPQRDRPQYSARMPGAILRGLVARGAPLRETRGWHYRLTSKGQETVKQLDGGIYDEDRITVPDWLAQLKE